MSLFPSLPHTVPLSLTRSITHSLTHIICREQLPLRVEGVKVTDLDLRGGECEEEMEGGKEGVREGGRTKEGGEGWGERGGGRWRVGGRNVVIVTLCNVAMPGQ